MFATHYHFQALVNLVLQILRVEMVWTNFQTHTMPRLESTDLLKSMRAYLEPSAAHVEIWRAIGEALRIDGKRYPDGKGSERLREALRKVHRLAVEARDALPARELGMVEREDLDLFVAGRAELYGPTPEPPPEPLATPVRSVQRVSTWTPNRSRELYVKRVVMAYQGDGRAVLQSEPRR